MAIFGAPKYQLLDDKLESTDGISHNQSNNVSIKRKYVSTTVLLAATLLVTMIISGLAFSNSLTNNDHQVHSSTEVIESPYFPCGRNFTDAQAAGCIYDIMMNSWLRPECYDEELSADFQSLRDWAFYAEVEAKERLTVEQISQRRQAHTTGYYHFVHCIYSLRKVQRAIAQGRMIEEDAASMHHDGHCEGILQEGVRDTAQISEGKSALFEMNTRLNIGYPRCVTPRELLEADNSAVTAVPAHSSHGS